MYTWQLPVVTPQPVAAGTFRGEISFSEGEGVTETIAMPAGLTPGRIHLPPAESLSPSFILSVGR